jgi:hypothetical protein
MSASGTFRTCRDFRVESAFGVKRKLDFEPAKGSFWRKAAIRPEDVVRKARQHATCHIDVIQLSRQLCAARIRRDLIYVKNLPRNSPASCWPGIADDLRRRAKQERLFLAPLLLQESR